METIQKERVRTEYYNIYVANDGMEFTSEEECKKYEESAELVLNTRYKPLVVKESTEEDLFGFGCCDDIVEVVKPTSKDDVDAIMQLAFMHNPHYKQDGYKKYAERALKLAERAVGDKDVILIGRGCDYETFWLIGTTNSMKEQLDFYVKPAEKKDEKKED